MARLSWPDFHYRQRYMNTSKEDRFILDYSSRGLRLWALDAAVSALWHGRKDLQEQSFLSHGPCKAKRKTQRAQGQALAFKDKPPNEPPPPSRPCLLATHSVMTHAFQYGSCLRSRPATRISLLRSGVSSSDRNKGMCFLFLYLMEIRKQHS